VAVGNDDQQHVCRLDVFQAGYERRITASGPVVAHERYPSQPEHGIARGLAVRAEVLQGGRNEYLWCLISQHSQT
jgi:hypothetical protein